MKGSIFIVDRVLTNLFYPNTLVLINSDTLNLLRIFEIADISYCYLGLFISNKAFIVDDKLGFIFPDGMNYNIFYFNDDMTINNTESIYGVVYFNFDYNSTLMLYKYTNNTLYLASKKVYYISDTTYNIMTAITKFDIQYQTDEWDNRVFKK